jgi:hypothetical protein
MEQKTRLSRPRVAAPPQDDSSLVIGTWEIVDFSRRQTNGEVTTPFGSQATGRITYDADGNVVALLMHEKRNEAAGRPSSPEVQEQYTAYFGTYTPDTARQVITHHIGGSLSAERASGELRRHYEFRNVALILTFIRTQDGATNTLVWKRVSRLSP